MECLVMEARKIDRRGQNMLVLFHVWIMECFDTEARKIDRRGWLGHCFWQTTLLKYQFFQ